MPSQYEIACSESADQYFVTATGIPEVGLLAETLKSGEQPISPQILCSSAAVNSRNLWPHQIFNLTQQEKNGSLRP